MQVWSAQVVERWELFCFLTFFAIFVFATGLPSRFPTSWSGSRLLARSGRGKKVAALTGIQLEWWFEPLKTLKINPTFWRFNHHINTFAYFNSIPRFKIFKWWGTVSPEAPRPVGLLEAEAVDFKVRWRDVWWYGPYGATAISFSKLWVDPISGKALNVNTSPQMSDEYFWYNKKIL